LLAAVAVGSAIVPIYNLELFGGVLHTDLGFALSWGAFPVITAYLAQTGTVGWAAVLAAGWATLLSLAQRSLSTVARTVRREVVGVEGRIVRRDGTEEALGAGHLSAAPERALRLMTASTIAIAAALAAMRGLG
jgi:hypothetical protein